MFCGYLFILSFSSTLTRWQSHAIPLSGELQLYLKFLLCLDIFNRYLGASEKVFSLMVWYLPAWTLVPVLARLSHFLFLLSALEIVAISLPERFPFLLNRRLEFPLWRRLLASSFFWIQAYLLPFSSSLPHTFIHIKSLHVYFLLFLSGWRASTTLKNIPSLEPWMVKRETNKSNCKSICSCHLRIQEVILILKLKEKGSKMVFLWNQYINLIAQVGELFG